MKEHYIFFDNTCKLCRASICHLQKSDLQHVFTFFPLHSVKAEELLPKELLQADTVVLLEDKKRIWTYSKAVFRILKLRGGKWSWLGFLCYVPGLDLFYRLFARHRHFF